MRSKEESNTWKKSKSTDVGGDGYKYLFQHQKIIRSKKSNYATYTPQNQTFNVNFVWNSPYLPDERALRHRVIQALHGISKKYIVIAENTACTTKYNSMCYRVEVYAKVPTLPTTDIMETLETIMTNPPKTRIYGDMTLKEIREIQVDEMRRENSAKYREKKNDDVVLNADDSADVAYEKIGSVLFGE